MEKNNEVDTNGNEEDSTNILDKNKKNGNIIFSKIIIICQFKYYLTYFSYIFKKKFFLINCTNYFISNLNCKIS